MASRNDRIVNTSILQTMTRSVNTLATVVITLVALLVFGGGSLQNFAFALLVGICSGGYHSIFYSAPLVVRLRNRQLERAERRRALGLSPALTSKPRTVAEARAQATRSAIEREAIVAARRDRKEKEKLDAARTAQQPGRPGRYRKAPARRRPTPTGSGASTPATLVENDSYLEAGEEIDPLDAQQAGLHDEALELGHEEITLNLDEPEAAPHDTTPHSEPKAGS